MFSVVCIKYDQLIPSPPLPLNHLSPSTYLAYEREENFCFIIDDIALCHDWCLVYDFNIPPPCSSENREMREYTLYSSLTLVTTCYRLASGCWCWNNIRLQGGAATRFRTRCVIHNRIVVRCFVSVFYILNFMPAVEVSETIIVTYLFFGQTFFFTLTFVCSIQRLGIVRSTKRCHSILG